MTKESADREPNATDSHPVSRENEKQVAERDRRQLEDALEDDEVYEELMSLRVERRTKKNNS
jgi:hypothetical protein